MPRNQRGPSKRIERMPVRVTVIRPTMRVACFCKSITGVLSTNTSFRRDSHYVPHVYLKFGRRPMSVCGPTGYSCPMPKSRFEREIHSRNCMLLHLTPTRRWRRNHEIEKWLEQEFETPAEESLRKVTSDAQLTEKD